MNETAETAHVRARPEVSAYYHEETGSLAYVVADPGSGRCAVIDPVLDYDPLSDRVGTAFADRIRDEVRARGLTVDRVLDTHIHADHVSAVAYLADAFECPTGIGARVPEVQTLFKDRLNLEAGFRADGSQFGRLWRDGETFRIGALEARVVPTPGHTPACVSYLVGDAVFSGDTLFMPDYGTARADFPGGSAAALFRSIRRLLDLPAETRMFVGHDYPPETRGPAWESTVARQAAENVLLHAGVSEADFVAARRARDRDLSRPRLFWASIEINIRGGRLPAPESNGRAYFKVPVSGP